ncbi:unnamed protein product [Rhizophagus irregularis]|uniref:Uncharacterized protein n=1 Tax=Rhizophagus irregularis TaxID=588596 RepID=A0A2N1NTG8_9GLOM|nr:hypothetical protein RhiirC2_810954 [Rhizophagus irregularis]CAB4383049.1 unnamed protein product [Rhizophagus irregularis]
MDNNLSQNGDHSNVHQSNLTDNDYSRSSTNDVNQAEHLFSNFNYNDANTPYGYTDFLTMNDNILSPPAYTPIMSSNYVSIPDPNEQQYISTSHSYTSTTSPYVPDQNPMQHIQNIPTQVTPLDMNVNFSQTNRSEIFRFDIPGFQIQVIVIPVSSPSTSLNNSDMLNQGQ